MVTRSASALFSNLKTKHHHSMLYLSSGFHNKIKCIPWGPFFGISAVVFCIKFSMFAIRWILDLIRIHLINWFYEIWNFFLSLLSFLWGFGFLDFWDVVGILYKHMRCYQFHQISILCDHQRLACTQKDPPRRVDMNEMSLISFRKNTDWIIDKTVWKLTLLEPLENRICAFVS